MRFPFAARLNELHRLRGCGWVWWRGEGPGKGARGGLEGSLSTPHPLAQVDDTCASGRQETVGGRGVLRLSGPSECSYLVPALLSRSRGRQLTAMRTLYKDSTIYSTYVCRCVIKGGLATCLSVCHLDVLVRFRAICWQRLAVVTFQEEGKGQ